MLNRADGAVRLDDVMDALKELDRRYGDLKSRPRYRRILENRIPGVFGREDDAGKPGRVAADLVHRLRSSGDARISAQNTLYFERGA